MRVLVLVALVFKCLRLYGNCFALSTSVELIFINNWTRSINNRMWSHSTYWDIPHNLTCHAPNAFVFLSIHDDYEITSTRYHLAPFDKQSGRFLLTSFHMPHFSPHIQYTLYIRVYIYMYSYMYEYIYSRMCWHVHVLYNT